jgi:C4-dicarboxylate-specific signal transduction histidine kinase
MELLILNSNYDEVMKKVAHQWRQPLSEINSIVMVIASVLEEKNINDDIIDKKLSEIEVLTNYMSKTIDDFSETHKKNVDTTFHISSVINELLSIVSGNLRINNIEFIINIEESFKYAGNASILLQAILIIVNNAKDALIDRNVFNPKIILSVLKRDEFYIIEISDNGGGMTKK